VGFSALDVAARLTVKEVHVILYHYYILAVDTKSLKPALGKNLVDKLAESN
jgi:hypothetical protein